MRIGRVNLFVQPFILNGFGADWSGFQFGCLNSGALT